MRKIFTILLLSQLLLTKAFAKEADYHIEKVQYQNLVAELYLPKAQNKLAAVIAFGGSEGGLSAGKANGEMIAPHGVAVLGLAFFDAPGIAKTLDQIPLEYFIHAIDYLASHPKIDANRIGVVSGSRGSEAAFLMATHDKRIKSVVVTTPSKVAWNGLTQAKSAWTYQGKDIPALGLALDGNAKLLERFSVSLQSKKKVARSLFKFEQMNGPLLMISAQHDQVWPSYQMAKDIEQYLTEKEFAYPVKHDTYATGHGFSQQTAPKIKQSIAQHIVKTL
ncbi:acyl-CoA thioester hydrolase/BAAT C-terminal domain-containing protein [Pseudoalteromonas sp. T1lg23B]|uniref:acyl-CoA thioester hydrolase/BAAT C-terminal domain-containing protein n=1 Tax=Pseudoalteromonas sp. T1lg23B TaxID=2077097 RepID=UPI000CF65E47|nr:acyl-CoA thioester hydrolase/BAAT C-terminal domain-containing protein [Pseudoalteromonas sp. T1lg23B]